MPIPQEQKGITTPFRRDGSNDFANGTGLEVIKSDVLQLISIIGPNSNFAGEMPWDMERGSRLIELKHRSGTQAMAQATAAYMVSGVIGKFDKRVSVLATKIEAKNDGKMKIDVVYNVTGFDSSQGETVSFFSKE